MIKSNLNELMPIYLQLFNAVLTSGTMPQTLCDGLSRHDLRNLYDCFVDLEYILY